MKVFVRVLLILMITTMATVGVWTECPAIVIDETVSVGAGATKVEDIDLNSPVLDNFNDGGIKNHWDGVTGIFPGNGGTCTVSNDPSAPFDGDFCLKLDYNVTALTSYSGYYTKLKSTNFSTRGYLGVSFYVKGAVGGEYFKIEIKNNGGSNNTNQASMYVTDYLDGGVTTSWQRVTIPFHNFANISSWSSMKELVFTFEGDNSRTNGSPDQGTIYIDKIEFITDVSVESIVRIDHFGDNVGVNALGGNIGSGGDGGSCSYGFDDGSDRWNNYPRGLRLDYNVNSGYAYCAFIFGGGYDRWTKISHNFSSYTYISFSIRAEDTANNPEGIKIELHDFSGIGAGEPFYVIRKTDDDRVTIDWKQFKIPLSSFKDWDNVTLDKSRISELVFTFENGNAIDKVGIIYIDEVQFEK